MFDSYISLGDNCEAGLQFERIGYHESSFFRYLYSPVESTIRLLENDFKGVFLRENLVPHQYNNHMVCDVKYDIYFHSQLVSAKDSQGNLYFLSDYNFEELYQQELGKVHYFIQKWEALAASGKRVLYLMKDELNPSREKAEHVTSLVRQRYPDHDFLLVYLQVETHREPEWNTPNLVNRYFPRFAPVTNAFDADLETWDSLFAEFPLFAQVQSA